MTSPTPAARLWRLALVACLGLAVLITTFAVLTGADVVPADARANPIAVAVTLDGVAVPAGDYTESTVTMCPQAATVALRFHNRVTGKPLARRRYTIFWSTGGAGWRSSRGITGRGGAVVRHLAGRLSWIQVAANGYNHYFTVRYRRCTASVGGVRVSKPFGVRRDKRAHVRVTGTLYAQRSNGSRVRFAGGRVVVRSGRTRRRIATMRANAHGTFSLVAPVPASTRLIVTAAAGPTGPGRAVSYGPRWILRPERTSVVRIPAWMRGRHVRYTASPSFSPWVAKYAGSFADPTVMRVGKTYYAASTTSSGLNLPLMTSKNLTTWRPRPALSRYYDYSSWPGYNDALALAPAWAARFSTRENVKRISQWAPSLARVGPRRYVAAFSAATRSTQGADRRSCIGLAVSDQPAGPYRAFARPLVCDASTPFGAIDPDVFVDPRTHHVFLVWAAEGIPGKRRVQLAIRQLNWAGSGWAKGSRRHNLLTFSQRWEGVIMENPSMIRYRGTLYLFYSANAYGTSHYATGYAICRSVAGPCTKPRRRPLLATRGDISGPGGADAFIDAQGRLRLAYAAWRRGHAGQVTPGRVLHIATLVRNRRTRHLAVRRMG